MKPADKTALLWCLRFLFLALISVSFLGVRSTWSDYAAVLIFLTLCATIIPVRTIRFQKTGLAVNSWFAFGWLPRRVRFDYGLPLRVLRVDQAFENPTVFHSVDGLGPDLNVNRILLLQSHPNGRESNALLTPTPELLAGLRTHWPDQAPA